MSLFNNDNHVGWGVVNFSGGEEYEDQGTPRTDGSYAISVSGEIIENDHYVKVKKVPGVGGFNETSGHAFRIPHFAVDLMVVFDTQEELDDYLLEFAIQEIKGTMNDG